MATCTILCILPNTGPRGQGYVYSTCTILLFETVEHSIIQYQNIVMMVPSAYCTYTHVLYSSLCLLQVYAINTGTYGTLESIFELGHANNGHQLMTVDTDNCMT